MGGLDGAKPAHCIDQGDGGVPSALLCRTPRRLWRRRWRHAQAPGDHCGGAIVHQCESIAEGAGEGVGEGECGIRLELPGLEVDLVLSIEGPVGWCRVASSRLGLAELSQRRAGLSWVAGQELKAESPVELGKRVAVSVDG